MVMKRDYMIMQHGPSRGFPVGDPFLDNSSDIGDIVIHLGGSPNPDDTKTAILVELDTEPLGVHTGEHCGNEGSNVLGFARYRNGNDEPSNLIEIVRQPNSRQEAIDSAVHLFETAGFDVVLCADQAGRIIDRLVRPKYNSALRLLDEGLATADAMDMACRLGLGYPDGPIERVVRGGLARHFDITSSIHSMTGQTGYMPARRAVVAKIRDNS